MPKTTKICGILIILTLIIMGVVGWISDGSAYPVVVYISTAIIAFLGFLAYFVDYLSHPIIKTRAKVVKKHATSFLSTFPSITFQLPNGEMKRVVIWSTGIHNLYKIGDEVMLTYKGDRAREIYHFGKQ